MYKKSILPLFLLLLATWGCSESKQPIEVASIDVKSDYPERTFVLQDLMDVEYVPLETSDEFITQGVVQAVGKDFLLIKNWGNNGDIFLFDRHTGKGLRKINRLGQGAEEYSQVTGLILDEANQEIFVKDNPNRKIGVYDYAGNFKRKLDYADSGYYVELFDYDRTRLLAFMGYYPEVESDSSAYLLISKEDGRVVRKIDLPYEKLETPVVIEGEATITPGFCQTVPSGKEWILMRTSSDTLYRYTDNDGIQPLFVRTPSIHGMDVQKFLFPYLLTDRYCFLQVMEKSMDFKTMKGFP